MGCVCVCVYLSHNFSIHALINGHLCCFHVLAVVNNAIYMRVHISLQHTALFFFGYAPRSGILDHMVVLFLIF